MTVLTAQARVRLREPGRTLDAIRAHCAEHEMDVRPDGTGWRLVFEPGEAWLHAEGEALRLRAQCADLSHLLRIRLWLAAHLLELAAPETPAVIWTGDGSDVRVPPHFRTLSVVAARTLTPCMRRLTFAGENLARFDAADLHCKLLIPSPDSLEPGWPTLGRDGLLAWPGGAARPAMRTYTIRRIDVPAGRIEIDFVLHADGGPGGTFAARAQPGDVVGMLGPGGRGAEPADWTLLAGDETALPAMARILEAMPRTARGVALIEVADAAERQVIEAPDGVAVRWLLRDGHAAGSTSRLREAVVAQALPADGTVFAWAGAEFHTAQAIRTHWRRTCGLPPRCQLAVAYWRREAAAG
jgi:NADPH-dependent ferric siderophore reductase